MKDQVLSPSNLPTSCFLAFVGNTQLRSGVSLEEVEGDPAQDGDVLGCLPDPDAAIVFAECDVLYPVRAVFCPVRADGVVEQGRPGGQAADVVAPRR